MLQGNIWGKITILEFEAHENLMFSILLSTEQVGINIRDVRGGLFFHGAGWGETARKSTNSQSFTKCVNEKI